MAAVRRPVAVLDDGSPELFVARGVDREVGWVLGNIHDKFFANRLVVQIEEILVARPFQHRRVCGSLSAAFEK